MYPQAEMHTCMTAYLLRGKKNNNNKKKEQKEKIKQNKNSGGTVSFGKCQI